MALTADSNFCWPETPQSTDGAVLLSGSDGEAASALCRRGMKRTWFEPHVLTTGAYFGTWLEGELVCIGGTHVLAPQDGVAALGDVCTDPRFRRQGLAKQLLVRLCQHLIELGVRVVALNVKAANQGAISMYKSIGFVVTMEYVECDVQRHEI